ncbi:hypothetical protein VTN00DRAFT_9019 [Thermoascus crustaceus]|uniref:uncharacterized protein n=1 Tax=Thermoascus crustaceus TaxID=5088 RepID=UPI003742F33D
MPTLLRERVHVPEEDVQLWDSILIGAYSGAVFLSSPIFGYIADCSSRRNATGVIRIRDLHGGLCPSVRHRSEARRRILDFGYGVLAVDVVLQLAVIEKDTAKQWALPTRGHTYGSIPEQCTNAVDGHEHGKPAKLSIFKTLDNPASSDSMFRLVRCRELPRRV